MLRMTPTPFISRCKNSPRSRSELKMERRIYTQHIFTRMASHHRQPMGKSKKNDANYPNDGQISTGQCKNVHACEGIRAAVLCTLAPTKVHAHKEIRAAVSCGQGHLRAPAKTAPPTLCAHTWESCAGMCRDESSMLEVRVQIATILYICKYIHINAKLKKHPVSFYSSTHPPIYPSMHPSIHSSIYPSRRSLHFCH